MPEHFVRERRENGPETGAEPTARENSERFELVFDRAPVGMALVAPDFRLTRVNDALCDLLGYSERELVGRSFVAITHPDDVEKDVLLSERIFRGEIPSFTMEKRLLRRDGEVVWIELRAGVVHDSEGKIRHGIGIAQDITERKRREEELLRQTLHDVLTELPNRALLGDRVENALSRARRSGAPVALLFMDLDGFKTINDRFGHAAGDHLLREVSDRLRAGVRQGDTPARVGGDEFAVLLPEADAGGARVVANRLLAGIVRPLSYEGRSFGIMASIGGAFFPQHADEPGALMVRADRAMYAAKRSGGGYALYRQGAEASASDHAGEATKPV